MLRIARSDRFPVGTSVAAYAGQSNRHHEGKPSGPALETQTVAADGTLTFPGIAAGSLIVLYAVVGGVPTSLPASSSEAFTPPGTLRQRLTRRRQLAKV